MSRKVFLVAVIGLCLLGVSRTIASDVTESHEKMSILSGHITTSTGERIPARTESIDEKQITFQSSYFEGRTTLPLSRMKSFGFHQPQSENSNEKHRVRFHDGTVLTGEILSTQGNRCTIQTTKIGVIEARLNQISEICIMHDGVETNRYSALDPSALADWVTTDAWGRCVLPTKSELLKLPDVLEADGCFHIEFDVDDNTDLQILYGYDSEHLESIIGLSNGAIVLETSGGLEFGEYQPIHQTVRMSLKRVGDEVHLLNVIGQSIMKLPPCGKSLSLALKNLGSPLRIRQITLQKNTTPFTTSDMKYDNILSWSNEGVIEVADQTAAIELLLNNKAKRVWLGTGDAPKATLNDEFTCLWNDGDRINCQRISLSDQTLVMKCAMFSENSINLGMPPNKVFIPLKLNSSDVPQTEPAPFRLAIGGATYRGHLSWGDSLHPICWLFTDFDRPVLLNHGMKLEILNVKNSKPDANSANYSDRLLLNDGSLVPCKISRITSKTYEFQSKKTSRTSIDASNVRCCFFDVTQTHWTESLTSESVQQALTLPRFSKDQAFSHVVISKYGDLLRGSLISMNDQRLAMESHLEPLSLKRESIAGIISLPDNNAEVNPEEPKTPSNPDGVHIQLDCGGDDVTAGHFIAMESGVIRIDSDSLGPMSVQADQVRAVAINSSLSDVSPFQKYAAWKIMTAMEPRWESSIAQPQNARELLNTEAPDFNAVSLSTAEKGQKFQLSDHRGKVVVLSFWATDSRPSVVGITDCLLVLRDFSPDDLVFAAVNQRETASKVTEFIRSQKWSPFQNLLDSDGSIASLFQVNAIPHLIVIDRKGIIRSTALGYTKASSAELKATVKSLLEE